MVHRKPSRAHHCIMGACSAYFTNILDTKWKGKSNMVLRHPLINPVAFGALLQYLHTMIPHPQAWIEQCGSCVSVQEQTQLWPWADLLLPGHLDVSVEHSDCECLAKQCQLWINDLEGKCKVVSEFTLALAFSKPSLPQAFSSGHSDYFQALLDDHLEENEGLEAIGDLSAITLNLLPSPAPQLQKVAYDVLRMANMLLLGLKQLCDRSLAQLLDEDTMLARVGVWPVAKLFSLVGLEDQCNEYMAKVIKKIYSNIEVMQQQLHALEDLLVSIGLDC
ncbi:LOW QUALITY PROTEIN: ankyrin repeat and BTB/POZ domain-containing protein 1 [Glossophaga mutica]